MIVFIDKLIDKQEQLEIIKKIIFNKRSMARDPNNESLTRALCLIQCLLAFLIMKHTEP